MLNSGDSAAYIIKVFLYFILILLLINLYMIKKAMILAAGFGTRLKPFTDTMPKALAPLKKGTMLSYQIEKLKSNGVKEIVINAHHYYEEIEKYLKLNDFGVKIDLIIEEDILGTGGGLLNAADFLKFEDKFYLVNVDVYTDLDFRLIEKAFDKSGAIGMLAVQKRMSKRYLEFDKEFNLLKRVRNEEMKKSYYAFNGIHVLSRKVFHHDMEVEYKDIIDIYLELVKKGEKIIGFDSGKAAFIDMGKTENLLAAEGSGD